MNAPVRVEQLLPQLDHTHLDWLEEEAIFILRETVAAFEHLLTGLVAGLKRRPQGD